MGKIEVGEGKLKKMEIKVDRKNKFQIICKIYSCFLIFKITTWVVIFYLIFPHFLHIHFSIKGGSTHNLESSHFLER